MTPEEYVRASMEDSFLMPYNIVHQIEEMNSKGHNESKIMILLKMYGIEMCKTPNHRDFFETLQTKQLESADKLKDGPYCLGCGGLLNNNV